jgi:hypothetical protein
MNRSYKFLAFLCSLGLASQLLAGQIDASRDSSAAIIGRVTDTHDAPVSADLMIYGRAIMDGRVDIFAMCSTSTDADGKYACKSLRPGKYVVSATVKHLETKLDQPISVVYPRTFSPAAATLDEASVIQIGSGATRVADIVIQPGPPGKLVGQLAARPKSASFLVRSHFGSFDLPIQGHVDYDPTSGAFSVSGLPRGTYSVSADWWAAEKMHHSYGISEVISEKEKTIILSEVERHPVSGSLRTVNDSLQQPLLPTSVELVGLGEHVGWQLEARVATDGSFAFPEILDGDYVLRTPAGSSVFVESISSSGRSGSTDILRLRPGEATTGLDVALHSTSATVPGMLKPDGLLPGRSGVVLESLRDQSLLVVTPDQNGKFAATNLPPGDYRLFAWSDLRDAEYRNAAELVRLKKSSKEIHVDNDSHLTGVELELIPSGS